MSRVVEIREMAEGGRNEMSRGRKKCTNVVEEIVERKLISANNYGKNQWKEEKGSWRKKKKKL